MNNLGFQPSVPLSVVVVAQSSSWILIMLHVHMPAAAAFALICLMPVDDDGLCSL